MALTLNEIVSTTLFDQREETADAITQAVPTFLALADKGKIEKKPGGYELRDPAMYQLPSAQWFTGYQQLDNTPVEVITEFQQDWRQVQAPCTLDGFTARKNKGSKTQLIDILDARMNAAKKALQQEIQTSLKSDGTRYGSTEFMGLGGLCATTQTNTYGGIDRSTYTWACAQTYTFSTLAKTASAATIQEAMLNLWLKCVIGSDQPDLGIFGTTYWSYYHNSLTAIARMTDPGTLAKAGFQTLRFMNMNIVLDNQSSDSSTPLAYFLNTDTLRMVGHSDLWFQPLGGGDREPYDQDAVTQYLACMGNLCCNNPRMNGVLSA